jgi:hypothetical protein
MSKVFKMNDCDWVYASSEEEAKKFYSEFEEEDIIEEDFKGEVSLQDTMLFEVSKLPIEEQQMAQEMRWFGGELCVSKPFEWVIKQENIKAPCIIASTEY